MEVKKIVKVAIDYAADVFSAENPRNVGLEEITFNDMNKVWKVTVGFSRPWDYHTRAKELLLSLSLIGGSFKESHISKSNIFRSTVYNRLGVADTGFVQKSKRVNCSFTVDFDLYQTVSGLGRKIVNFNHLRQRQRHPVQFC